MNGVRSSDDALEAVQAAAARIRMSKRTVTRLFVGSLVALGAGAVLGVAALTAALASDAIDIGGSHLVDVHAGTGVWTAMALVVVGSLAALVGSVGAVVSWLGALGNTWQLEDKTWFWSLVALGLLGVGLVAMIAYVAVGPDGTEARTKYVLVAGAN
jgi:H+/Cl- antiporter ClcA